MATRPPSDLPVEMPEALLPGAVTPNSPPIELIPDEGVEYEGAQDAAILFRLSSRRLPRGLLGHDLIDPEAAHKMAVECAGEILQHEAQALVDGHDLSITVSDENHLVLFSFYATSMAAPSMAGRR